MVSRVSSIEKALGAAGQVPAQYAGPAWRAIRSWRERRRYTAMTSKESGQLTSRCHVIDYVQLLVWGGGGGRTLRREGGLRAA